MVAMGKVYGPVVLGPGLLVMHVGLFSGGGGKPWSASSRGKVGDGEAEV